MKRPHELRRAGVAVESRACVCHQCRWANDQARSRGDRAPNVYAYRLGA